MERQEDSALNVAHGIAAVTIRMALFWDAA
jgi:hypothetical protein